MNTSTRQTRAAAAVLSVLTAAPLALGGCVPADGQPGYGSAYPYGYTPTYPTDDGPIYAPAYVPRYDGDRSYDRDGDRRREYEQRARQQQQQQQQRQAQQPPPRPRPEDRRRDEPRRPGNDINAMENSR